MKIYTYLAGYVSAVVDGRDIHTRCRPGQSPREAVAEFYSSAIRRCEADIEYYKSALAAIEAAKEIEREQEA